MLGDINPAALTVSAEFSTSLGIFDLVLFVHDTGAEGEFDCLINIVIA